MDAIILIWVFLTIVLFAFWVGATLVAKGFYYPSPERYIHMLKLYHPESQWVSAPDDCVGCEHISIPGYAQPCADCSRNEGTGSDRYEPEETDMIHVTVPKAKPAKTYQDQSEIPAPPPMDKPGASNPKQYGLPTGATELQDLIEFRNMNFACGNMFKAIYRMGTCSHSDELRDLRKILWFAQREIDRLEPSSAEKLMKRYPPYNQPEAQS